MLTIKMLISLNVVMMNHMAGEQHIPFYNNLKINSLEQAKQNIAKCVHSF